MKILVTGSDGFIGQHLMSILPNADGWDIRRGQDIFDLTKEKVAEYDAVIHLAAIASIPASIEYPDDTMEINVAGTQHIIDCQPEKLIFASSGSVTDPRSPYADSKLAAEKLIQHSGVDHVILRLGNVYGENDDKSAIMLFQKADTITLYGDGEQTRSFVHAKDVARAFEIAATRIHSDSTYHIGNELLTLREVAEMFDKPIKSAPAREFDSISYPIDFDGMPQWTPQWTLKGWLAK